MRLSAWHSRSDRRSDRRATALAAPGGPGRLSRLPELLPSVLSEAQRALYDRILSGAKDASGKPLKTRVNEETGGLLGPFNSFLRSPELGGQLATLAETLRFGDLHANQRLLELCILRTVRSTGASYALWSHAKLALAAGLPSEVIDALQRGEEAQKVSGRLRRDEQAALLLCDELLQVGMTVSEETYRAAVQQLGERCTFEVSATVGFYLLLSAVLKTFDVRPPEVSKL